MKWDSILSIPTATTDADPIAAPGSVPTARLATFRPRAPDSSVLSTKLIVGLSAPAAENVTFIVYALDSRDENAALAARRYYQLFTVAALVGGTAVQINPTATGNPFVADGTFYIRITTNNLTTTRELCLRACNS